MALMILSASAQIQPAWVAHYDHGVTNSINYPIAMVLDTAGNIYITGYSSSDSSQIARSWFDFSFAFISVH